MYVDVGPVKSAKVNPDASQIGVVVFIIGHCAETDNEVHNNIKTQNIYLNTFLKARVVFIIENLYSYLVGSELTL
ncbi:hypothetical protein GCM10022396_19000 [Flavivirga amylovorans]